MNTLFELVKDAYAKGFMDAAALYEVDLVKAEEWLDKIIYKNNELYYGDPKSSSDN